MRYCIETLRIENYTQAATKHKINDAFEYWRPEVEINRFTCTRLHTGLRALLQTPQIGKRIFVDNKNRCRTIASNLDSNIVAVIVTDAGYCKAATKPLTMMLVKFIRARAR